ncbi:MAG: metallophosphoesterase family protein, partial [Planctomycetes bacterium]|nr:metallophosphoesterase family protein [Planctomycetota bacterium]
MRTSRPRSLKDSRLLRPSAGGEGGQDARPPRSGIPCPLVTAMLAGAIAFSARAATLVFQDGTGGYSGTVDTFLMQSDPGTSKGTLITAEWDSDDPPGTGQDNVALIRFDGIFGTGPNQIAPTDEITSATLSYDVVNSGNSGNMYEAAVAWTETATWNNYGGDPGVQSDEYGALVGSTGGGLGPQSINVVDGIAAWAVNPAAYRGWIILPVGTDGVEFRSREDPNAALRPKLTVVVNEGTPPVLVTRGPYLQLATPHSMVVRWRTDLPSNGTVRYGASPASLTGTASNPAMTTEHEINVTGLSPNTLYYYSVGTSDEPLAGGTPAHFFYTPPDAGTRQATRIWAMGDFGTANNNARAVRNAYYAYTGSTYTDLWLMLGDNAYNSGTDSEFQSAVFNTYQSMLIQTVFWSTRGNHETDAAVYYNLVTNPTGGEAGGLASGSEAYYSFDYANIHFVCLDSYVTNRSPGGAMMTWLTNDVASTNQDWIIAFWHHPPYSKGTHNSDTESNLIDMRQYALPILEAGGVDLVLCGHSH